jgi:hypothetical protein
MECQRHQRTVLPKCHLFHLVAAVCIFDPVRTGGAGILVTFDANNFVPHYSLSAGRARYRHGVIGRLGKLCRMESNRVDVQQRIQRRRVSLQRGIRCGDRAQLVLTPIDVSDAMVCRRSSNAVLRDRRAAGVERRS